MTAGLAWKVVATDCQKATEWSASGRGCWATAAYAPGEVQWRSRMATMPAWLIRLTSVSIACW